MNTDNFAGWRSIVLSMLLSLLTSQALYSSQGMQFELTAKTEKGYLTLLDIPGLSDVTLPDDLKDTLESLRITNVIIGPSGPGIKITGTVQFGAAIANVIVIIRMLTTVQSCLQITFPQSWKFSDLNKKLSAIDLLHFSKAALVITNYIIPSYIYDDAIWGNLSLESGVHIIGTVTFDPDSNVAKIVPGINQLVVHGLLTPTIAGSSITGIWPVRLQLSEDVKTTDLTIGVEIPTAEQMMVGTTAVTDLGPTIIIETGLEVTLPAQTTPLFFRTAWNFMPLQVRIEGSMDNIWKGPFGITGIGIGNMGIEGTLTYLGMLTGMGIRGQMDIGNRSIIVAGKGSIGGSSSGTGAAAKTAGASKSMAGIFANLVLIGEFQGGLYLSDLAAWAMDIAQASTGQKITIPIEKVPGFGLRDIKVSIVPKPTEIAEKMYPRGLTVSGKLQLAGVDVALYLQVNGMGVRGFGTVEKMVLGPLTITGAGEDKLTGTRDDGAIVNVQLDPLKQEIYIDGFAQLALFGATIRGEQHLLIGTQGLTYTTSTDIFQTELVLDIAIPLTDPNKGYIKAHMSQESLNSFADVLRTGAQAIIDSSGKDISKEKDDIKKKIAAHKRKLSAEKKKCKKVNIGACSKVIKLGSELHGLLLYQKVILKAGSYGAGFIAQLTNAIASNAQTAFNVEEISFEGYIKDLTSAKLPRVRIKGVFLGKKWDRTMQLDLQDIAAGAEEIIDQLEDSLT